MALKQPLKQITNSSAQIKDWNTPVNEVIQWKSKDGAEIEGVLLKPKNYDAKKKYPLLVVIHGGPTGIDLPNLHQLMFIQLCNGWKKGLLFCGLIIVAALVMGKVSCIECP
jgi:hypothetical protein